VLVEVTPRGLVQHREALAARRAHLAALLGKLSADDVEALTKALGPMEHLADQEGGQEHH
jgi:DNA-binding MarR family transcriptional regulator